MNASLRFLSLGVILAGALAFSGCGELVDDLVGWHDHHDNPPTAHIVNALDFDGANDYVLVPNSRDLQIHPQGSFTIDAWVRSEDWSRWNWVASHATSNENNDFLFGFDNGRMRFITCDLSNDLFGQTHLETGRWYHVAGVQDVRRGTMRVYLDGELEGELRLSGQPETTTGDFFIGARESYGTGRAVEFFNGILRGVRIWKNALSQAQIRDIMGWQGELNNDDLFVAGLGQDFIANWPLDEGRWNTAYDRSGNGHDGRIYGDAQWVKVQDPIK